MISNRYDSMILFLSVYMVPASFECGMIQVKGSSLVYKDYLDFLAVKKNWWLLNLL